MTALGHHLTRLETSGLIRLAQLEPELEYIFRHALVQDAAYHSLLFADRRKLHRQVGEKLEQVYANRLEELASTLARHFSLAEDTPQALKYYTLAGDVAARVYANTEASNHYTHALEITRHNPDILDSHQLANLYTKLGRTYEIGGDYSRALEVYIELESQAQDRDDQVLKLAALMARATVHATPTGEYDMPLARTLSQQALHIAGELRDHEAEARIYWNLLLSYMYTGEIDQAAKHGETSLRIARQHNLQEREAYALHDLMRIYLFQGQTDKAITTMLAAKTMWQELDNKPMLADCLSSIALVLFATGDYTQTVSHALQAHQLSLAINNLWNQSYSQLVLGPIYTEHGHVSQAIDSMKACIEIGDQAGFIMPMAEIGSYLGYMYGIVLDDLVQGFEWANRALDRASSIDKSLSAGPLSVLALLHLTQGDFDQATKLLEESQNAYSAGTLSLSIMFVTLAGAEIPLAQQNYAQAIESVDQTFAIMHQRKTTINIPGLLHIKARALLAQKRFDQANTILQDARTKAEAIGSKRTLWQILAALAQIEEHHNNPAGAANLRQQALQIIDYIAAHIHQPNLRASFLNRPDVRAVMEATKP